MITHNLNIALRLLSRQKRFTIINVIGLAIGFTAYILTNAIVRHETTYDLFFENSNQIYAVYTKYKQDSGLGVNSNDGTFLGVQPLLASVSSGIDKSARSISNQHTLKTNQYPFYQSVRFVDPDFFKIFRFKLVGGDIPDVFSAPDEAIITQSAALQFFGQLDVLGSSIQIDNRHSLKVVAVIEDLPRNSHFRTTVLPRSILDPQFSVITTIEAYRAVTDREPDNDWSGINLTEITYALLNRDADVATVNADLLQVYDRFVSAEDKLMVEGFALRPLAELSQYFWNATGLPVLSVAKVIGVLILLIAILNYTLLANAQAIIRTREIGLRKVTGAGKGQLFVQFSIEGILLAVIAFACALLLAKLALLQLDSVFGQSIDILGTAYWHEILTFASAIMVTGVLANAYLSIRVSKTTALECLSAQSFGNERSLVRNTIIGIQFFIAMVLSTIVLVIMQQNQFMQASSSQFTTERILTVDKIADLGSLTDLMTLRSELEKLPSIERATLVSQPPYAQGQRWSYFTPIRGDSEQSKRLLQIWSDENLLRVFDISLVAGRDFSRDFSDVVRTNENERQFVNVIINRNAARRFGWSDPNDALGNSLFFSRDGRPDREHIIVGVMEDVNYLGFHNRISPSILIAAPDRAQYLLAQANIDQVQDATDGIEITWRGLAPEKPLSIQTLSAYFDELHGLFRGVGALIAPLALTALALSFFGLFGLSAYSSEQRTREIAIRKVVGASSGQIVKLFVLQSCKPVFLSLVFSVPMAFLMANFYLDFFAERINSVTLSVLPVAAFLLLLSILTVSLQTFRASNEHPMNSLREH